MQPMQTGQRALERHTLPSSFLERFAKRGGSRFELSQPCKRGTQIVLGRSPIERHTLPGSFLQRFAVGCDRLFEPRGAALALPQI
jgi:hypothetical protein